MAKEAEIYEKFLEWNFQTPQKRVPRTMKAFGRENDVAYPTLCNWIKALGTPQEGDEEGAFRRWIQKRAYEPGCPSEIIKLYARILKLDVVTSEVTHKFELTADDHARVRKDAAERIREVAMGADRDRSLLAESIVLSDKVRKNS